MRNKKAKLWALGISLLAHFIFVVSSAVYELPQAIRADQKKERKVQVQLVEKNKEVVQSQKQAQTRIQPLRFESSENTDTLNQFLEQQQADPYKDMILLDKDMRELAQADIPDDMYDTKQNKPEYNIPKKMEERAVKDRVVNGFQIQYEGITDDGAAYSTLTDVSSAFVNKMPGHTPALVKDQFAMHHHHGREIDSQKQISVIQRQQDLAHFDQELVWTLETYQDPEDGQNYFKVQIRTGQQSENLKSIPKEITVLVDCSKSITSDRLNEFKKGIEKGLEELNKEDVFNLVFFKEWNFEFEKKPVAPTPQNIRRAVNFMKAYDVGEKTNTFKVLEEAIQAEPARHPAYILLFSDGRPTKGVTQPRELINKISEMNQGKKPIFTLTGGMGANRYLLDFISYKNRAWSEYSYRTHRISDQVHDLFKKINDPIIMKTRYFISGIDQQEVFPKKLSDLYRHAEMTLYGRYDNQKTLAFQLLGDVGKETREFLLEGSLLDAPQGDATIAEEWAYNKIYHLISLLEYQKDNKKLLEEIEILSQKYDLKTPYLEDILL